MNCALSIKKYTSAIVEALEPRMNGKDLGIVSAGSNVALLVGMNFSHQRPPHTKILVWKN
jgi:hypothetical protein